MAGSTARPPELCPRFHRASELIGRRWTGAIIFVLLERALGPECMAQARELQTIGEFGRSHDRHRIEYDIARRGTMKLYTHLNFGGNCEEAFRFYEKHLGGKIGTREFSEAVAAKLG